MKRLFLTSAAMLAAAAFATSAADANTITGLVNTGAGLTDGQIDPNYAVMLTPAIDGPSTNALAVVGGGFPFGYWVAPPTDANWISAYGRNPNLDPTIDGTYDYQLSFFLNTKATSLTISGDWAVDNRGSDILLNGVSTGDTTGSIGANGYGGLTPFVATGTGNAGWNYLDFRAVNYAQNGGNPTGLLVTDIAGIYTPAPEPASLAMLGVGIFGIAFSRRRQA